MPQFLVRGTGSVALIYLMMLAMRFVMSALYGPIAAILAEGFEPHVRYTGISLSYQLCNMIFGALAPLAALSLAALAGGHYWPVAALLMVISAIGIHCTAQLRKFRVVGQADAAAPAAEKVLANG